MSATIVAPAAAGDNRGNPASAADFYVFERSWRPRRRLVYMPMAWYPASTWSVVPVTAR